LHYEIVSRGDTNYVKGQREKSASLGRIKRPCLYFNSYDRRVCKWVGIGQVPDIQSGLYLISLQSNIFFVVMGGEAAHHHKKGWSPSCQAPVGALTRRAPRENNFSKNLG